MSDELTKMREFVELQFMEALADAQGEGDDVAQALAAIRVDVEEAMSFSDTEHVKKIVTNEIPTMPTLNGLELRDDQLDRVRLVFGRLLGGMFAIAIENLSLPEPGSATDSGGAS